MTEWNPPNDARGEGEDSTGVQEPSEEGAEEHSDVPIGASALVSVAEPEHGEPTAASLAAAGVGTDGGPANAVPPEEDLAPEEELAPEEGEPREEDEPSAGEERDPGRTPGQFGMGIDTVNDPQRMPERGGPT